jgi:hypothetical protein
MVPKHSHTSSLPNTTVSFIAYEIYIGMLTRIVWKWRRRLETKIFELCCVVRRIRFEVVGRKRDGPFPSAGADRR